MSEKGVSVNRVAGGCASPGTGICKAWQGTVEVVLRVATLVSATANISSLAPSSVVIWHTLHYSVHGVYNYNHVATIDCVPRLQTY